MREASWSTKKIVFYLMMAGMKWGNRIVPGLLRRCRLSSKFVIVGIQVQPDPGPDRRDR
jgi:hypothetical protein